MAVWISRELMMMIVEKSGSFGGDALEDVVDERVHDAHGFAGDTSVTVNLLQHLVEVDSMAFLSLSPSLLFSIGHGPCIPYQLSFNLLFPCKLSYRV